MSDLPFVRDLSAARDRVTKLLEPTPTMGDVGTAALRAWGEGGGFGDQLSKIQAQNLSKAKLDYEMASQDQESQLKMMDLMYKRIDAKAKMGDRKAKAVVDGVKLAGYDSMTPEVATLLDAWQPEGDPDAAAVASYIVQNAGSGKKNKAPETRDFVEGDQTVTKQWDEKTGAWREISRASRWQPKDAKTSKGPDGYEYYIEGPKAGQRVLPNVKSPRDTFMEMLGGGTAGGSGNDTIEITGAPAGATISGGTDTEKKSMSMRDIFYALPPEAQHGILAAQDPMQAFSSYMLKQKGMEILFDDNGRVKSITQGGKGGGLTPAVNTEVQKKIMSSGDTMAQLTSITSRFKPEYQQIGTRWDTFKTKWMDKAGLEVSPEDKKLLEDFTSYRGDAAQLFSLTLKDLSGVAVNPTEYKRAEAWLPSPGSGIFDGDSPTEMRSKLDRFTDFTRKALMKYAYIQKNGLTIDDVDVAQIPSLMNKRGNDLAEEYRKQGMGGDALKEAVKYRLADEFGLLAR